MDTLCFAAFTGNEEENRSVFLEMLSAYFDEICADKPEDNIPKQYLPRILDTIIDETKKYELWAYMCVLGAEKIGFCIFQIDTKENPLCKREGWGFIREFYIASAYRREGYATRMCTMAENVLREKGAEDIYLTANAKTGEPFWRAMGYVYAGGCDDKNGNKIYEKRCVTQ